MLLLSLKLFVDCELVRLPARASTTTAASPVALVVVVTVVAVVAVVVTSAKPVVVVALAPLDSTSVVVDLVEESFSSLFDFLCR